MQRVEVVALLIISPVIFEWLGEMTAKVKVHKSQGPEFHHTVLVQPRTSSQVIRHELIFTGLTRAVRADE